MSAPNQLTLLRGDSRVSLFPQQDSAEAKMMTASSGRICLRSLKPQGQPGLLRKMSEALLTSTTDWYSSRCALIWRPKVTKYNRLLFQLSPLTPHTGVIESGLLPTAVASEVTRGQRTPQGIDKRHTPDLQDRIAMLPTPQAIDGSGEGRQPRLKKDIPRDPNLAGSYRADLKDRISMLPTPQTDDADNVFPSEKRRETPRNACEGGERYGWEQNWTEIAAELCLLDDGLPVRLGGFELSKSQHRKEQLKAYGNAIVPQVAIEIMRGIKCSSQ